MRAQAPQLESGPQLEKTCMQQQRTGRTKKLKIEKTQKIKYTMKFYPRELSFTIVLNAG